MLIYHESATRRKLSTIKRVDLSGFNYRMTHKAHTAPWQTIKIVEKTCSKLNPGGENVLITLKLE